MILIYSDTLRIKCQGKLSTLFGCFAEDSTAPVSASVATCGGAAGKLENRGRQDHENQTLIQNGAVPLLNRTIAIPTIQRKVRS